MSTILGFFAHPDDETVCSGTLTKRARDGARVVVVYATRGENGQIVDPSLATRETLPEVREHEMYCAAEAIGAVEPIFLGYHDSGMEGSENNGHPNAFINADEAEVTGRLVEIIRREKPDTIMTFDPSGGYGHPDHISINRRTVAALDAAADAGRFQERGDPWRAQRLLYPVFPRSLLYDIRQEFVERGLDTAEIDQFLEMGAGFPQEGVDHEVDISDVIDAKWQALKCHRTQFGPNSMFFKPPEDMMKRMMSIEYFVVGAVATESR